MTERRAALTALSASTIAFGVCFAAWVINSVLVTHLVSAGIFRFSEPEIGWLFAAPILTGALSRVPLGMLADRYGGRGVFALLMAGVSVPLYFLSLADSFAEFFLLSLAFGFAGGSFAAGFAYVSAWFPLRIGSRWLAFSPSHLRGLIGLVGGLLLSRRPAPCPPERWGALITGAIRAPSGHRGLAAWILFLFGRGIIRRARAMARSLRRQCLRAIPRPSRPARGRVQPALGAHFRRGRLDVRPFRRPDGHELGVLDLRIGLRTPRGPQDG